MAAASEPGDAFSRSSGHGVPSLSKGGVLSLSKGGVLSLSKGGVLSLSKGGVLSLSKGGVLSLSKGGVLSLSKGGVLSLSKDSGHRCRRAGSPTIRWVLILLAAVLTLSITAAPGTAKPRTAFHVSDSRITKPASLAADTASHRYWTVNRSDDSGRAYALTSTGKISGAVRINAELHDVEAVQSHGGSLYLADIGDRKEDRSKITVYEISYPQPNGSTVQHRAYEFRYPDRPQDARALLVDGHGRMSIITRGRKPGIYRAPADPSRIETNTLTRAGAAPKHVTDATTLSNGKVAVRDDASVRVLDPDRHYKLVGRTTTPKRRSGAALGRRSDGKLLLVANAGPTSKVYAMPVPDKVDKASGSPSSARASGTSSATSSNASASPSEDDSSAGIGSFGITIAVIAAALVGVAAGVVTYFVGGRSRPENSDSGRSG